MKILPDRYSSGPLLLIASAAAGLVITLYHYMAPLTGVTETIGAGLVVFSTSIMLVAAIVHPILPSGVMRKTVMFLILVDAVCSIAAGYFLHEWLLIVAMVVALIGAMISAFSGTPTGGGKSATSHETQGAAA
ncbi:hypothetical protein [uncultured Cohaesibacter sp.]|uniref:hypothetical protein n=1 Tax=uncultured Cohaesibacter sp. TaxID=1002546 RepID=UPI002AA61AAF|nr:hypothetical protein [uncultured Cohaesibacter sp.]